MSVFGTGRLQIIKGNMNQDQYKTMPEKRLLPQLNEWASRRCFSGAGDLIFMHDDVPCHKGRSIAQFLAERGIETLTWPWGILKSEMKKKTTTNKQNLIDELISVWVRNDKIRNDCGTGAFNARSCCVT